MKRFMRNARLLWRAESMLGAQRVSTLVRRSWLMALTAFVMALGITMLNFAAFLAAAPRLGEVGAALTIGLADLAVAVGLIVLVQTWPTGSQMSAIMQVRDLALEELEADVAGVERVLANTSAELRQVVAHPFGSIAPAALMSLTKSVLATLRSVPRE
jgi:hypothetical protein